MSEIHIRTAIYALVHRPVRRIRQCVDADSSATCARHAALKCAYTHAAITMREVERERERDGRVRLSARALARSEQLAEQHVAAASRAACLSSFVARQSAESRVVVVSRARNRHERALLPTSVSLRANGFVVRE